MLHLPFVGRMEAGRLLANELCRHEKTGSAVIIALARGGVPVGFAVANRLGLPLDIVVVRKLGVPGQPELAMGAISAAAVILDDRIIRARGVAKDEIRSIVTREEREVARQEELYRAGTPPLSLPGRTAVLIDDGLATGSTMSVAIEHVRTLQPERIVVAVPVGSRDACDRVRREADGLVCLACPPEFFAVGEWYRDFPQVGDAEVRRLLMESRQNYSGLATADPTGAGNTNS